jgi:hypothetical protein
MNNIYGTIHFHHALSRDVDCAVTSYAVNVPDGLSRGGMGLKGLAGTDTGIYRKKWNAPAVTFRGHSVSVGSSDERANGCYYYWMQQNPYQSILSSSLRDPFATPYAYLYSDAQM